ncbi:hypothetical protein [Skermania piniformis]|uniref:Uncharacterized protein n=1 Tax=Skermania pinensis TaxID=39122 RepID=A0ABX8SBU7_9ACTN|nr:hypothetical protein [Skermania piniformis]QXQ15348.1 hypothetical protein KV203_08585 [Skermania piniformis]
MSEQGNWDDFVVGLCDLTMKYNAKTYLYEGVVVMSARRALPDGRSRGSVRVTRFDDEAARIETGWCFDTVVDYVSEDRKRPVPALGLVEAICSGNAEEHCLIDSSGAWVGVVRDAWLPDGHRWESGSLDSSERRATRRFPSWIDPT